MNPGGCPPGGTTPPDPPPTVAAFGVNFTGCKSVASDNTFEGISSGW